jgi:hypothetical protein
MQTSAAKPLDYLTIGHVTKDLAAGGFTLGGTASYSPLTANSFGLRSGIFTSYAADFDVSALSELNYKNSQKKQQFKKY